MKRTIVLLATIGVLTGLLMFPAASMHWTPGNGNPAAPAQELGTSNNPVFSGDWRPLPASWPFAADTTPGNGEGPVAGPGDSDSDGDSDEADAGICVIGVDSPCNAPRWDAPERDAPQDDDTLPDGDTPDDAPDDSGVTEERHVTEAPSPSSPSVSTGEGWISYPNPRNHMPRPSTAIDDPSIKVCAVLLNQANEVITGTTVPDTRITMDTSIDRYEAGNPVTFTTPLEQYADLIGTDPSLPEGDGYLDAECVEFHNLETGRYTYSPPSITGQHADEIEFVGVTEYAGARPSGNPFEKEAYEFGTNDLSDGVFNLEGEYDQRHGEAIYFFRLK